MAISVDPPEEALALSQRINTTFPLLSDPDMSTITAYGVAMDGQDISVPATFVIRPSGTISWRHIGERVWDRPLWDELLAEAKRAADQ